MVITGYLRGRALIRKQPSYYSAEQAFWYLQRIGWAEGNYTTKDIADGCFPANLENLEVIVRRHYLSFTNDTTLMHYSAEHYLDITPEATFKRLVTDKKGGTYCYGHHNLMLGVIRALGYRSYSGIARMNFGFFTGGGADYQAYGHMILFVQLGEGQGTDPAHTWVIDCAPGPPVPMLPIPLSDDSENVIQATVPGEYNRLTRGFSSASGLIPPGPGAPYSPEQVAQINDIHALWQVEYRGSGKATDYTIVYQFSEQEFTTLDYNVHHYAKMHKPFEDVFSYDVVCAKFTLGDDDSGRRITERQLERWTLFRGVFKRRLGNELLEKIECSSEEDRVNVLRRYFGITIEDKDIVHIKGTAASWEKMKALPGGDLL
ncbi:cysteine proteinase [Fomitiporia mediterranea MF3/22]|uniref:cysteine proteinase n=1 Tax=Fomitiporia mediterranea (strain MF3/22) TaxID=694068 RepID=UPI0004407847|nr:cysteine proteinase [Fomitiporia mediterranea MF3/22]EJD00744.1 cysteine proteinase [Fomitiporia mediterranea MF3/22]